MPSFRLDGSLADRDITPGIYHLGCHNDGDLSRKLAYAFVHDILMNKRYNRGGAAPSPTTATMAGSCHPR
jgi:hypothetical protein